MKRFLIVFFLVAFSHITIAGGGGGGCSPSDNSGSPTTVTNGITYSYDNTGCGASADCASPYNICSTPGFSNNNGDCYALIMGATCTIYGCFCGSPENTSFAQFCPSATANYTFSVSNISCSGGGASLQYGVYEAGATCDSGSDMFFCENGTTANQSQTLALTAGSCYRIVFDGNAGADCTWNFNISSSLPLALIHFEGTSEGAYNAISWTTSSEEGTDSYVIERSTNGMVYGSVSEIENIQNSITEKTYHFNDFITGITNPVIYYRIKRVEKNGNESYSAVIAVENENLIEMSVYPSLFSEGSLVHISLNGDDKISSSINIFSIRGEDFTRKVNVANNDNVNYDLDFNSLTAGTYIVSVTQGNKRVSKTIVKF